MVRFFTFVLFVWGVFVGFLLLFFVVFCGGFCYILGGFGFLVDDF